MDLENLIDKIVQYLKYGFIAVITYGIIVTILFDDLEDVDNFDDGREMINDIFEDYKDEYLDICRLMNSKEYDNWTDKKQRDLYLRQIESEFDWHHAPMALLEDNTSLSRDEWSRLKKYHGSEMEKLKAECSSIAGRQAR